MGRVLMHPSLAEKKVTAYNHAALRARLAGLDDVTASAVADRVIDIWDPEYTEREWNNFIDQEIEQHANP